MKAKLYVCVLLTALIAVFTISGCTEDSTVVDKLAASTDEVIANVIENVPDETGTTTTAITTTVAPTETTVGETTTAPEATTKAEEVTEPKVNNQTSDKANTSNADKEENNTSTQKPNNTSNSNTSGNTSGNTTSNTTTNKPSSNTNSNTEKPKPAETQPPTTEAPAVITDDTPLPYEQIGTEENMQRMVDDCIEYFTSLGMTYNEELDPSWSGWYYGHQGGLSYTDVRSYNETSERNIIGIKEQVDAVLINYAGYEYTDITFKPCYELTDKGTYSIIFCYG